MSGSYCAHGINVEHYHCMKCPPGPQDVLWITANAVLEAIDAAIRQHGPLAFSYQTLHAVRLRAEPLRAALAACPMPKHGDPIGGFAEPPRASEPQS